MQVLKYTEENEIEEAEVIQVAVSRAKKVGSYHMMNGQNPIYVISFTSRPAKKEADPKMKTISFWKKSIWTRLGTGRYDRRYCGGYYESDLWGSDTGENPGRNGGI